MSTERTNEPKRKTQTVTLPHDLGCFEMDMNMKKGSEKQKQKI